MVKKLVSKAEFARMAGVTGAAVTKAIGKTMVGAVEGKRIDANHPDAMAYLESKQVETESPATGIDPLYESAVQYLQCGARASIAGLQREFKIGHPRASAIMATLKIANVVTGTKAVAPSPPIEEKPKPLTGYAAQNRNKKQNREPITDPEDMLHSIPEDIRAFADMSLRDLVHRFGTDVAFLDWLKATKAIEDINEKRLKNAQTRGELVSRHLMKIGVIEPIDSAHIKLLTDGAKTIARRVTAMTAAGKSVEDCEKFVADQMTSFIRPIKAKVARALKNA